MTNAVSTDTLIAVAAISAAGGIIGALAGGVASWLAVSKSERSETDRQRLARQSERELEDERRRNEFQRQTIIRAQELTVAMWAPASNILRRKVDVLGRGDSWSIPETDPDVVELARTRVELPIYIERLYSEELRRSCWIAAEALSDASMLQNVSQEAELRAQMGDAVDSASKRLAEALRDLH